jgi:hypothetical protein
MNYICISRSWLWLLKYYSWKRCLQLLVNHIEIINGNSLDVLPCWHQLTQSKAVKPESRKVELSSVFISLLHKFVIENEVNCLVN